jgi:hypothetical protein
LCPFKVLDLFQSVIVTIFNSSNQRQKREVVENSNEIKECKRFKIHFFLHYITILSKKCQFATLRFVCIEKKSTLCYFLLLRMSRKHL